MGQGRLSADSARRTRATSPRRPSFESPDSRPVAGTGGISSSVRSANAEVPTGESARTACRLHEPACAVRTSDKALARPDNRGIFPVHITRAKGESPSAASESEVARKSKHQHRVTHSLYQLLGPLHKGQRGRQRRYVLVGRVLLRKFRSALYAARDAVRHKRVLPRMYEFDLTEDSDKYVPECWNWVIWNTQCFRRALHGRPRSDNHKE